MNTLAMLSTKALAMFAPPPDLTVSEWADAHRRLSPESSSEPGQWSTDRAPYQRGIMDAINDPEVESIVVMSSAQIGKTAMLENIIGYFVSQDPSPILLLMPTLEMAATFSKDRLSTMLRDTPALHGLVKEARARDSGNTQLHKQFPGGHITMTGANSPANLASRPIRVVLCDEVDRYPESAGSEGDPVNLARKRTATFWNRKIIMTSTPTIKDLSRIEAAYAASDMRRYWVPCPHCGDYQALKWANVRWDEGKPETAHYVCEHCGCCIDEASKGDMLAGGEWRAECEFRHTAGFHLNELYSPWRRWAEIAADFLEAKHGGTEMLKAWTNTSLGESWEENGDGVEMTGLMARVEDYARDEIPLLAITFGVDVQKDRIEASIVGWGKDEEAWMLDHHIFPGDTARPEMWGELAALFPEYRPDCVAIDSGFNAQTVYDFVKRYSYCRAIKGTSGMGRPLVEDDRRRAQRLRAKRKTGGYPVEPIGVDGGKILVHSRLRVPQPGPGYIHFPNELAFDEEYFGQLTAEKLITRYRFGRPIQEWHQTRPRNEALDCLVYAFAALRLWGRLEHAAARYALRGDEAACTQTRNRRRRVVSTAQDRTTTIRGFINL